MRLSALSVLAVLVLSGVAEANDMAGDGWKLAVAHRLIPHYATGAGITAGASGAKVFYIGKQGNRFSDGVTALTRTIPLDIWQGHRLRLTLRLKDEGPIRARVTFRLNKKGSSLVPPAKRDAAGNADWQMFQFVVDVPVDATSIDLGIGLNGNGRVWVADAALEAVSSDVPLTARLWEQGGLHGDTGPIMSWQNQNALVYGSPQPCSVQTPC